MIVRLNILVRGPPQSMNLDDCVDLLPSSLAPHRQLDVRLCPVLLVYDQP